MACDEGQAQHLGSTKAHHLHDRRVNEGYRWRKGRGRWVEHGGEGLEVVQLYGIHREGLKNLRRYRPGQLLGGEDYPAVYYDEWRRVGEEGQLVLHESLRLGNWM